MYALGKLTEFENWMRALTKREVFSLMDFTWQSSGVMKGQRVLQALKAVIPDINIEDMPIPFKAVATDLHREQDVVFEKGSFYEAVRSSIAIPAVFTAVSTSDSILVDGGVLNPLPLSYVNKELDTIVVAVNLEAKSQQLIRNNVNPGKNGIGSLAILQQAYYAMRSQMGQLALDLYKPEIIVDIPRDLVGIWDYEKADFLIGKGKELTSQSLLKYKRARED